MQISGATVLVTGGGSGLGAGLARTLMQRGARVVIIDLPSADRSTLASGATFHEADVSDPAQVERAMQAIAAQHSRLDVCVNAAGVNPAARVLSRRHELHSLELFRRTLNVNLVGAFDVIRHSAALMSGNPPSDEGERGLIVNVASIAALEGQAGQAAYSASKGGLVALTLPLARDLAIWGIRVMTICPGAMDTPMLAALSAQQREEAARIPVFPKRLGTVADFASLVMTFMETTGLNGETVRLDSAARLT
jgi:3-hydroxyacyl-CoA dehydrogenase / 3-hydroxy-2-methylbutyryl-CoA dehydrogenase